MLSDERLGVKQDKSRAKALDRKVCDLGEQERCNVYKMLNEADINE